jgi:hypothetical protein
MSLHKSLTVIIPAYNEAEGLRGLLPQLLPSAASTGGR